MSRKNNKKRTMRQEYNYILKAVQGQNEIISTQHKIISDLHSTCEHLFDLAKIQSARIDRLDNKETE